MGVALAAARRLWVPAVLGPRPVSTGAAGRFYRPSGAGRRAKCCSPIGQLWGGRADYGELIGGGGAAGAGLALRRLGF